MYEDDSEGSSAETNGIAPIDISPVSQSGPQRNLAAQELLRDIARCAQQDQVNQAPAPLSPSSPQGHPQGSRSPQSQGQGQQKVKAEREVIPEQKQEPQLSPVNGNIVNVVPEMGREQMQAILQMQSQNGNQAALAAQYQEMISKLYMQQMTQKNAAKPPSADDAKAVAASQLALAQANLHRDVQQHVVCGSPLAQQIIQMKPFGRDLEPGEISPEIRAIMEENTPVAQGEDSSLTRKPRKGTPMKRPSDVPSRAEARKPPPLIPGHSVEDGAMFTESEINALRMKEQMANSVNPQPKLQTMKMPINNKPQGKVPPVTLSPTADVAMEAMNLATRCRVVNKPEKPQEVSISVTKKDNNDNEEKPSSPENKIAAVKCDHQVAAPSKAETKVTKEILTEAQILMLNGREYEIVSMGDGRWISRSDYELMEGLGGVESKKSTCVVNAPSRSPCASPKLSNTIISSSSSSSDKPSSPGHLSSPPSSPKTAESETRPVTKMDIGVEVPRSLVSPVVSPSETPMEDGNQDKEVAIDCTSSSSRNSVKRKSLDSDDGEDDAASCKKSRKSSKLNEADTDITDNDEVLDLSGKGKAESSQQEDEDVMDLSGKQASKTIKELSGDAPEKKEQEVEPTEKVRETLLLDSDAEKGFPLLQQLLKPNLL